MNTATPPAIILPDVSVLRVTGSDATDFLQAQLSRRVDNLSPTRSALAGWHDSRGKVRAVFRVLQVDDGYLLSAPASLAEQLKSAMSAFVLRADVRVAVTDLVCSGILRTGDADLLPALPGKPNAVATTGDSTAVCVTPDCWHIIGPASAFSPANGDSAPIVAAEIRAGIPQVDQRTTVRYVAHMLNLDKLGAIDFDKGCFPGQEIIARTEHLGAVKRRAQAFVLDPQAAASIGPPASDTPIADSHNERVGEVLRAARDADGSIFLLAVVKLAALADTVYLDTADGAALEHLKLPFA